MFFGTQSTKNQTNHTPILIPKKDQIGWNDFHKQGSVAFRILDFRAEHVSQIWCWLLLWNRRAARQGFRTMKNVLFEATGSLQVLQKATYSKYTLLQFPWGSSRRGSREGSRLKFTCAEAFIKWQSINRSNSSWCNSWPPFARFSFEAILNLYLGI